jgi:TRAP-type uncharacterized transport system fused permease subunit
MATITPPVAITSYAAASIAGAPPMKVGFMSMKVGMVAYILPFAFIFKPGILLYGTFPEIAFAFLTAAVGTAILAMGLEGWFLGMPTGYLARGMFIIAGILIVVGNLMLILIAAGIAILSAILVYGNKIKNKRKEIPEVNDEKV